MISDPQLENVASALHNDVIGENSNDEVKEDAKFFGQLDVESRFDPANGFEIIGPLAARFQSQQS